MNKLIRRCLPVALLAMVATGSVGQTLEEAKDMYRAGDYAGALPVFSKKLEDKPRDASLNHWTGVCLMQQGMYDEAIPLLEYALKRKVTESPRYLAEIAFMQYRVDDAEEYIEAYKTALEKSKKDVPEETADLERRVRQMKAMLDRVECIEIIDSIAVDAATFFKAYRLTAESGSLNSSEVLPRGVRAVSDAVVYMPESKTSMMWAMPDENENYVLVASNLLSDGKWERPRLLGEVLNEGGDANYPFMLSDGITLYFANTGENSIGGYDIFISRRDEDTYFQPQNIGMPYNSPYDDYMLAIDEITGVGWWATDRNRLDGKITIYKFIPKEMRENYAVDEPSLVSMARIASYRDTWVDGADYSDLLMAIEEIDPDRKVVKNDFEFALPDGKVYTRWDDFKNPDAKAAMQEYVSAVNDHETTLTALEQLRRKYAQGVTGLESMIMKMEEKLRDDYVLMRRLANDVIRLETDN